MKMFHLSQCDEIKRGVGRDECLAGEPLSCDVLSDSINLKLNVSVFSCSFSEEFAAVLSQEYWLDFTICSNIVLVDVGDSDRKTRTL